MNVQTSPHKEPAILVIFELKSNFLDTFSKNRLIEHQLSRKFLQWNRTVPCGRTERRSDGQTDRHDEANSRFSKFCKPA